MLSAENNRPELKLVNEPQQLLTLVTVQPDDFGHDEGGRVHIILVVDVSGSMQGVRISKTRSSLRQIPDMALRLHDRISLVSFNDKGWFVFEKLGIDCNDEMSAGIESLQANGGTMISSGLRKAQQIVRPGEKTYFVLMSDGESFSPEEDYRVARELGGMGVPVSCGMIEADSPEGQKILSEIARITGGFSENIRSPEDINPFLSHCVSTSQSNTWENVAIEVEAVGGTKLLDWAKCAPVIDPQKLPGPVTSYRIALGTIAAKEPFSAVAKFQVPPKNQAGEYLIAKIKACYNQGPSQKTATAEVKVRISANARTPTLNHVDETYIAVEAKRAEQRGDLQTTRRLYLTIREKELANLAGKIADGSASNSERVHFEASSTRRARK